LTLLKHIVRDCDSAEKEAVAGGVSEPVVTVTEDHKTRIRLERQEYPNATLADAIEENLYHNSTLH
jgi:hypothetical protein